MSVATEAIASEGHPNVADNPAARRVGVANDERADRLVAVVQLVKQATMLVVLWDWLDRTFWHRVFLLDAYAVSPERRRRQVRREYPRSRIPRTNCRQHPRSARAPLPQSWSSLPTDDHFVRLS